MTLGDVLPPLPHPTPEKFQVGIKVGAILEDVLPTPTIN